MNTRFFLKFRAKRGIPTVLITAAIFLAAFALLAGLEKNLVKGLQAEKSYTRHAMETYRKDPQVFPEEQKRVFEVWSRADHVALAASRIPGDKSGSTASLSLKYPTIPYNVDGRPFCLFQHDRMIVVFARMDGQPANCSSELLNTPGIELIHSGDLAFSGRRDYWIYVLRILETDTKLAATEAKRALDGDFTLVYRTDDLPGDCKLAFTEISRQAQFEMAEPGKKFQVTDVIVEEGLPRRRLILGGVSNQQRCFIHYESGGIGHSYHLLVFDTSPDGRAKLLLGASTHGPRDLSQLRSQVGHGEFMEDVTRYYW
jgi:hypothetical protein